MINMYAEKHKKFQYSRGAALLIMVTLFMFGSLLITLSISRTAYRDVLRHRTLMESKQSFFTSESATEDAVYRLRRAMNISTTEVLTINSTTATATITTVFDIKEIDTVAETNNAFRKTYAELQLGSGASFNFGLHSDTGGITMENSSSVNGNIYSNGTVTGLNSNIVNGDIISAGPNGLVDGVHATGSVWANDIQDSTIDKDAYYMTISGTIVSGTSNPGSLDQATSSLAITDELLDQWETEAEAGGVIASTDAECASGTYTIDVDTAIGPLKIECSLLIDKNSTDLTLLGPVWVVGNIDTKSSPNLAVDPSLSGKSIQMIAHDPANTTSSSKIIIAQSASFTGASGNSFILMISRNDDKEQGGSEVAISAGNSAGGDLLFFSAHGEVLIQNSLVLKEVSAFQITLQNSAQVTYESGLGNLLFTGGPGGSFVVNTWKEVE